MKCGKAKENKPKKLSKNLTKELVNCGTFFDKINALTDLIKNKPKSRTKYLDQLLEMCRKKERREAIPAIDKAKDLFIQLFNDENMAKKTESNNSNEINELDKPYLVFLNHVKSFLGDPFPKVRKKMIGVLFDLMKNIKEQNRLILLELINRFGDPDASVSAHVSLLLQKYLNKRADKVANIVNEIFLFLGRPNLGYKPIYYSICFLNQIVLSKKTPDVANSLTKLYFSIFNTICDREDSKHKMLQALLTGLNRSIPYTLDLYSKISDKVDSLFRLSHSQNFSVSIHALVMLFHIKNQKVEISDRFYNSLYSAIPQYLISNTSNGTMLFLNLIYKSITSDDCLDRQKSLVKRLLQVNLHSSPEFTCSCILMLSEIYGQNIPFSNLFEFEKPNDIEIEKDDTEDSKKITSSWVFTNINKNNVVKTTKYLHDKINPRYCGSQFTSIWEYSTLLRHYHLSVKPFANSLLKSTMKYEGDPLTDFSHLKFIERFIRRTPKERKETLSVMSRESYVNPTTSVLDPEDVLKKDISALTPEEELFYKYYKIKSSIMSKKLRKVRSRVSDDESDSNDSDFNDDQISENEDVIVESSKKQKKDAPKTFSKRPKKV